MTRDSEWVLMAVEPLPRGDWLLQATNVLRQAGFSVKDRPSQLLAWDEQPRSGNLTYSDAYSVRRIWLSPRRHALGVFSRRIYFKGTGGEIDKRQEYVVLGNSPRPESPAATELIAKQWRLIQCLQKGLQTPSKPVPLEPLEVGKARVVTIDGNTFFSPPASVMALYREHGFEHIPGGFTVSVCPLESVPTAVARKFSERLAQAARKMHAGMKPRITSLTKVSERLEDIKNSGEKVREGHCVLFILPSKKQKAKEATVALFRALREAAVPFRRAYADDPLDHSVPDQLPSLLIAAGGRPHCSLTQTAGTPAWTIGVDISHPNEQPISVLALTLVDPDGGLVGAWTKEQPRDETARVETVRALLTHCKQKLSTYDSGSPIVVFRDGRIFENEDGNLYRDSLERDVSFFEYRKGGNPQIVRLGTTMMLPSEPLATSLHGTSTMFVTIAPPRANQLARVAKITWRKEWNYLRLTPREVGEILAASATAPGLGPNTRHVPASIYWADGIAGIRPKGATQRDLRFVGMPHEKIGG